MAKLTLDDITSGYSTSTKLNANNDLIEAAIENTLSRDGTTPNTMSADIDMNSNRVVNLTDAGSAQDAVTLNQLVTTQVANLTVGADVKATSVAALRLVDTTGFVGNEIAVTLGYYTPGDKGGGTWYWLNSDSSSTDNSGTIVKVTAQATGRWHRIYEDNQVNVRWFGATGDGSTDDTTDMQAALDFASASQASVYIPNGEYILTSFAYTPTSGQKPVRILGEAPLRAGEPENNLSSNRKRGVILHFSTISGSQGAVSIGDGVVNPQGVHLENLYILGQTAQNVASPTDTTVGITIDNCAESTFKNVTVSKFNIGFSVIDSWASTFFNCGAARAYMGIQFGAGSNALRLYSWKSHTCYWAGETIDTVGGIAFYSAWFETLTNGFLINNDTNIVSNISFYSPHCELITNYCFELGYNRSGTEQTGDISSIHFYGGYYDSVGSGVSNYKLRIADSVSEDVIINGGMGSFDLGSIDNNIAPVKVVRSDRIDANHAGGAFKQEFFGYTASCADGSATDIVDITVPDADCIFQVNVEASVMTASGSFAGMTQGTIIIGRKSGDADCYATYVETTSALVADNGSGAVYTTCAMAITLATNVVTITMNADNNQSQTSQCFTRVTSFGGERGRSSRKVLAMANA